MKNWLGLMITIIGLTILPVSVQADALADGRSKVKVQSVIPLKARAFQLEDVRLLDGPFKHAMEMDMKYLLELDPERLLHNFRVNAGLPFTAQPLGGWEEPKVELRGHTGGHYLTACALMYASTGDQRLKERANYMVAELAKCQNALGNGYLSAFPEEFFDRVEARERVWAPYYTLHKIYAGLLDVYDYCDNPQGLEVCKKFADWVIKRNAKLSDEQMQNMLGTEHGGMNEVLANLYAMTGEEKYLKIAQRFNHMDVIGPASKREDKLTGLHANTQIPKFIGTARQYELTGEDLLKTASVFFWNTVVNERSYIIGGHSSGERFSPKETLSESLGRNTAETCNTYNMLKLTRHLFAWDPQAQYADYYERALYNHILASQNPETGMMCYYVPLRSGSRKAYSTPNNSFWCCVGTGIENHAKYGGSIYFHSDKELYVNLFIASELRWKAKGLTLRQETSYPDESRIRLVFTCDKPVELNLDIRHPYWATSGFDIQVNGEKQTVQSEPGSYVVITRRWKSGDTVEVSMPFNLHTEGFRDNPSRLAIMNGPIVLCAEVDPEKTPRSVVSDKDQIFFSFKPVPGKPSTFIGPAELFRIPGEKDGKEVELEPFYKMHGDRRYAVYWDVFTSQGWQAKEEEYRAELARQKALEARTVDKILIGHPLSERDHNLQGEETDARDWRERKIRYARNGGWFSYDIKVLPDQAQELSVNYMGGGRGNRVFDILVDGKKIATEQLQNTQWGRTIDKVYPIPSGLMRGKDKITVRFQAHSESIVVVFGIRLLKVQENPRLDFLDRAVIAPSANH